MSNTANKQPIKVGILEISSQNKAILEYFFSDAGKSYFKEVSLDQASAYIIDYDSLGAKESWKSTFEETNKPGIIISIKEVDLPSTIWLQKPLTVKALKEAGESIREMMLNEKASPEPAITTIEEKAEDKVVEKKPEEKFEEKQIIEDAVEDIIEPQVAIQELAEETNLQEQDLLEIDKLLADDIIDIPSKSISEIAFKEEILEELENIAELEEDKNEELVIENTVDAPIESLLAEETVKEQTSKVEDSQVPVIEETELAMADTNASASSSSFATSNNFVDLDLNLSDSEEDIKENTEPKSSIKPIDEPEIAKANNNEDGDMDSLLESLISGGKNNEKPDEVETVVSENSADLLDFDLETKEEETAKVVEKTNNLPELTITNTNIIENDGSSLGLEESDLEDPKTGISDELMTTLNSLETTATVDDTEIENILHSKEKIEDEPKKTAEEELQFLLEEIRQEAEGRKSSKANTSASSNKKGGFPQHARKYATTGAEERWKLTCGDNKDTVDLQKLCSFSPQNHVISTLIETIKSSKQNNKICRMKFRGIIVVIDPETDRIYCDQSIFTEYYANICYEPISKEKIKVHQLDESEIRLYRKKMLEDLDSTHCTEAFIWTTSLLTSKGRLPKNTNINNKVGLSAWPNLTRVESIPSMMQIAALLHKNSWSLLEITKKSGISKKYVVAFYNAALALDMIETNSATSSAPLDLKTGGNENRSLFSRFLKKLTA